MSFLVGFTARAESLKLGGTDSGLSMMKILADAYATQDKEFDMTIMPNRGRSGDI